MQNKEYCFRFADYDSFADSGREQISRCIVCQRKLNAADDNFSDYSGHSGSIGPFKKSFIALFDRFTIQRKYRHFLTFL